VALPRVGGLGKKWSLSKGRAGTFIYIGKTGTKLATSVGKRGYRGRKKKGACNHVQKQLKKKGGEGKFH